ncbi:hypothetical protein ACVU7I_16775 [Patulibacter sp. S7RM1-6]
MSLPLAHETWFVHDDVGADWSFVTQGATLALLALAVVLTLAARLIASRWWAGIDVPAISSLAPWTPFVMRMHLAVSLIGLLSLGFFLTPTMPLAWRPIPVVLGVLMAVIAIMLFAGWRTREAAWLFVATGVIGLFEYGLLEMVQRLDMLGAAGFLLATGGGRWSADEQQGRAPKLTALRIARAAWVLRMAVGLVLIIVALNEKLAQPDLALKFLRAYPDFNVFALVGLGTPDVQFARVAGATEIFFGLMVLSAAMPQVGVLAIGIPFNLTLFFFGDVELLGHLPIYGTMVVLLVLGSSSRTRPLLTLWWPSERAVERARERPRAWRWGGRPAAAPAGTGD